MRSVKPSLVLRLSPVDHVTVEHPYTTAVGGNDDHIIPGVNHQVMDIGRGQVTEHLPGFAPVFCNIDSYIRSHIEYFRIKGILADHVDRTDGDIP
jgi:hypothetical protein